MAFTFRNGEHHRNPSGQHNKIKWLLEQSHRDINKIHEIVSKIVMGGYDMISSWIVAEMIASEIEDREKEFPHWYDLIKDPKDLPKEDCETVTLHENGNKNIIK